MRVVRKYSWVVSGISVVDTRLFLIYYSDKKSQQMKWKTRITVQIAKRTIWTAGLYYLHIQKDSLCNMKECSIQTDHLHTESDCLGTLDSLIKSQNV